MRHWALLGAIGVLACNGERAAVREDSVATTAGPAFRNVSSTTAYVGDDACTSCHVAEAAAYDSTNMSRSFHRWIGSERVETTLDSGLVNPPTGYRYAVVEDSGRLFQVELIAGPDGRRLHELRRRMDHVMGSGNVARTYFTESNGRLFQLPLTWYRDHGWDFSPGYEVSNPRFDRLMPDRCVACHSNFPKPTAHLEGKHAEWREGIGCERWHGPGALHVAERRNTVRADTGIDLTIVNPARLSVARRVDICEECHVHTAVSVLREGKDAFSYRPSQPLDAQYAYFKVAGSIDVVSHADRLRQSACFLATQSAATPMECATCHNPHRRAADTNASCRACHGADQLSQRLASSATLSEHGPKGECVRCHMPRIAERTVPHGSFTEHWIRVPSRPAAPPMAAARGLPVDPYFARDQEGAEANLYQAMGGVVYATLAADQRALGLAATALETALGKDRTRRDAHFLLGAAWEQVGRSKDARRALQVAVQLDSTRPEALRALAQATARSGGTLEQIEPLFRRALDLQPALAWIRAEYADWLQSVGRADDAVREYRAAVAEQPTLATAWFNLGTTLTQLADRPGASAAFQEAVRLDPALTEALAPLLEVSVTGNKVTAIRTLGSPLASLPMRERAASALAVRAEGPASLVFDNVPPGGFVLIFRPDGSLLCALPAGTTGVLRWDLMVAPGQPLGAGLYRAQVQGRDSSGNIVPPQVHHLGFVRAPR